MIYSIQKIKMKIRRDAGKTDRIDSSKTDNYFFAVRAFAIDILWQKGLMIG